MHLKDLDAFCKMLEFGKFNGKWDVKIDGLGCQHFVSEVEKTVPWLPTPTERHTKPPWPHQLIFSKCITESLW